MTEEEEHKPFARLEVHDGRQVLAEIFEHDEGGPALRVRRDAGVTVEVTLGPWSDDDAGWAKADAALAKDLGGIAAQLDAAGKEALEG